MGTFSYLVAFQALCLKLNKKQLSCILRHLQLSLQSRTYKSCLKIAFDSPDRELTSVARELKPQMSHFTVAAVSFKLIYPILIFFYFWVVFFWLVGFLLLLLVWFFGLFLWFFFLRKQENKMSYLADSAINVINSECLKCCQELPCPTCCWE